MCFIPSQLNPGRADDPPARDPHFETSDQKSPSPPAKALAGIGAKTEEFHLSRESSPRPICCDMFAKRVVLDDVFSCLDYGGRNDRRRRGARREEKVRLDRQGRTDAALGVTV